MKVLFFKADHFVPYKYQMHNLQCGHFINALEAKDADLAEFLPFYCFAGKSSLYGTVYNPLIRLDFLLWNKHYTYEKLLKLYLVANAFRKSVAQHRFHC